MKSLGTQNQNSMYDIVVVGAGISGLVAVYYILKKTPTLKLLIVEKETQYGGQITDRIACEGNRWFSLDQKQLITLCKELNVTYVNYPKIQKCFRNIWEFKRNRFALLAQWELQRFVNYFDLMAKHLKIER